MSPNECNPSHFGTTALHVAVSADHAEVVKVLCLHKDINVNAQESLLGSPLLEVCSIEVAKLLCSHSRIDLNIRSSAGFRPLHRLISADLHVLKWLVLEAKLPLDVTADCGSTPLHLAAALEDSETVKFLCEQWTSQGLDINARNSRHQTAFGMAAEHQMYGNMNVLSSFGGIE